MSFLFTKGQEKQDSIKEKSNPIVFGDFSLGYSGGDFKGLSVTGGINYQIKKDLFSFRFTDVLNVNNTKFFFIFPIEYTIKRKSEFALMYGKRIIRNEYSFHFSIGLSLVRNELKEKFENNPEEIIQRAYGFGFPIEIGAHYFNAKKERYRVLFGLIPVGKATSFSKSIGIKLYANINKQSYIGLGLVFGLGWHKKYLE